jgi:enterobactin synthetase component D
MSLLPLVAKVRVVERRGVLSPEDVANLGELPAATARFAEKRLVEFLLGRHAAQVALADLGIHVGVLPIEEERAPRWPAGIVGAITHCTGYAAAAVAHASLVRGIGIDAQPIPDVKSRDALRRTATDTEVDVLCLDEMTARTIAFSAKECVFKALAPTVGGYFGFEAARIVAARDAQTLEIALTRRLHPTLTAGSTFLVRHAVQAGIVYAALEWE